jgi:hypothetical protein
LYGPHLGDEGLRLVAELPEEVSATFKLREGLQVVALYAAPAVAEQEAQPAVESVLGLQQPVGLAGPAAGVEPGQLRKKNSECRDRSKSPMKAIASRLSLAPAASARRAAARYRRDSCSGSVTWFRSPFVSL